MSVFRKFAYAKFANLSLILVVTNLMVTRKIALRVNEICGSHILRVKLAQIMCHIFFVPTNFKSVRVVDQKFISFIIRM